MKKKNWIAVLILSLCLLQGISFPAYAKKASTPRNRWVNKGAYTYYYKSNGKMAKRFATIKGRTYYFSYKKGKQRVGWRYIGGYYYYFRTVYGKNGYMLKNCTVDGIRLNKKGRAKIKTAEDRRKLNVLREYQHWADLGMRPGMTDWNKLTACLKLLQVFHYRNEPDTFQVGSGNWDLTCAEEVLARRRENWPTAECYRLSTAFGYLANAMGLRDVRICAMPGHGWTIVNGVVYDATRVINRRSMEWFPVVSGYLGEYTAYYVRSLN